MSRQLPVPTPFIGCRLSRHRANRKPTPHTRSGRWEDRSSATREALCPTLVVDEPGDQTVQPRLDGSRQCPNTTPNSRPSIHLTWVFWVRIVSEWGQRQRVPPSFTDRLSFEKAECPLFQLSHERRNTGTNCEVIEFILFHILIPIAFVLAKQLLNFFRNATAIY